MFHLEWLLVGVSNRRLESLRMVFIVLRRAFIFLSGDPEVILPYVQPVSARGRLLDERWLLEERASGN